MYGYVVMVMFENHHFLMNSLVLNNIFRVSFKKSNIFYVLIKPRLTRTSVILNHRYFVQ